MCTAIIYGNILQACTIITAFVNRWIKRILKDLMNTSTMAKMKMTVFMYFTNFRHRSTN